VSCPLALAILENDAVPENSSRIFIYDYSCADLMTIAFAFSCGFKTDEPLPFLATGSHTILADHPHYSSLPGFISVDVDIGMEIL
jgi:hypothetical protein